MAKELEALLYQMQSSPGSGVKGCLVDGSSGASRYLLATQSTGHIPATGQGQLSSEAYCTVSVVSRARTGVSSRKRICLRPVSPFTWRG